MMYLKLVLVLLCAIIQYSHSAFFDYEDIRDPFNLLWGDNFLINQRNRECTATIGGQLLEGVCTRSPLQCNLQNGQSGINATCGILSSCCVFTGSCGDTTTAKVSYFRQNNLNIAGRTCTNTIRLLNRNVCQIRLDFTSLNLQAPNTQGRCEGDRFFVSQTNTPLICGFNDGQHMYIHVNDLNLRTIDLSILTSVPTTSWTIKVTQLHCPITNNVIANQLPALIRDYPLLAPPGCTQYYREPIGTVRSFGFGQGSLYSRPLSYVMCFRRTNANDQCIRFDGDISNLATDDVLNVPFLSPTSTTGQTPITSVTPGPFYIYFQTNDQSQAATTEGFELTYNSISANCA